MLTNVTTLGLPRLVVFGLDYVLWPFWVDAQLSLPFTKDSEGKIVDSRGRELYFYEDVPNIFHKLRKEKVRISVVSESADVQAIRQLFKIFEWQEYIEFEELSLPVLMQQFQQIHEKSSIAYEDTLYFDDTPESIRTASKLGIRCVLVKDGVTLKIFNEAFNCSRPAGMAASSSQ